MLLLCLLCSSFCHHNHKAVVVGFSIIQYTVRENVAQVSISIDRSTEISVPVSVLFCTLPATASGNCFNTTYIGFMLLCFSFYHNVYCL